LQEEAEHDRTVLEAALQLLAEEVCAAHARLVRGEIGFSRLGHPAIAAESAHAIRGSEQKGVLRMVAGLAVAGRHRFLPQALNEGAGGGMTVQEAWDRFGCRLAGHRVRELRLQEREKVLRRPHGKPFDRERQDVGTLAIG